MANVPFPTDAAHRARFEYAGIAHDVFSDGAGPGVLIMHELPGLTPSCLRLAAMVRDADSRVYLPWFFGQPGQHHTGGFSAGFEIARLCLRREFRVLATSENGPLTGWLRALCRDIYDNTRNAGLGIGVIGMCLTGNVVLSLMLEECVLAPVTCQPGLPFEVSIFPGAGTRRAAVGGSAFPRTTSRGPRNERSPCRCWAIASRQTSFAALSASKPSLTSSGAASLGTTFRLAPAIQETSPIERIRC